MKAAVLYGKEDVRLEELPIPTPGKGEVLLKVKAALTCGTDLKVYRRGTHARMIQPPALFGHEFSGTIEAVGPGLESLRPGQRVVAANSAPCRGCFFCQRNQSNLCQDLLFVNGAYAEYLRIPARIVAENLLEIPSQLSFQTAALTEPLACVVRGIEAAQPLSGETVILLGAGPIGLSFIQLLRSQGANVISIGKGKQRLEKARACGASTVFDLDLLSDPVAEIKEATPSQKGADLVIEAVGQTAAWSQALALVRPGGRVLLFGGCPAETQVSIDTQRFHYEELKILSVFHHTPEAIRKALGLLAKGVIHPEHLITAEAPLAQLPQVLQRMLNEPQAVKTAILP